MNPRAGKIPNCLPRSLIHLHLSLSHESDELSSSCWGGALCTCLPASFLGVMHRTASFGGPTAAGVQEAALHCCVIANRIVFNGMSPNHYVG